LGYLETMFTLTVAFPLTES